MSLETKPEHQDQQIPFKPWVEIKDIHAGKFSGEKIVGIFRTELPDEPLGSITFAEAITDERLRTWNVRMNDGEEALELIQKLHAWHRHILTLDQEKVTKIITRLHELDLRGNTTGMRGKSQETQQRNI